MECEYILTLQQLKYAIEIANCSSMNEAAKRLFISQPSLSNAIKELEKELGICIFDRTNRGMEVSLEGSEFLGYAKQIVEQTELIESKYSGKSKRKIHFSISTQHYPFVVEAFSKLINNVTYNEYELNLKETKTYKIIEDVKTLRSDIGVLYINKFNSKILNKLFSDNNLKFTPLFNTTPHIFIGTNHPLANKEIIKIDDIKNFTYIKFEQGENNSSYFSEEMINFVDVNRSITVSDRATLLNLLISTNSYTIGTGIIDCKLNGTQIKTIPIEESEIFTVGWITHKDIRLSKISLEYINLLNNIITNNYFDLDYCLL